MKKMIFIDTNIWCYYFDARLPEHEYVIEPLRNTLKSEEIIVNTVIVMEVAHYLTRNLDEKEAKEKIESFINLRNMKIVDFDKALVTLALELLTRYAKSNRLGGRDSTILASLDRLKIKTLFTHDQNLKDLAQKLDIEIIDLIP
ncbi:hypothetical protein DRO42_05195 [Candidatus Bathyarchaeota archaeon]|nr:MAG: hypothetical protein DRO42_05195 [Candidatus Bathyarchaeota archaeon]